MYVHTVYVLYVHIRICIQYIQFYIRKYVCTGIHMYCMNSVTKNHYTPTYVHTYIHMHNNSPFCRQYLYKHHISHPLSRPSSMSSPCTDQLMTPAQAIHRQSQDVYVCTYVLTNNAISHVRKQHNSVHHYLQTMDGYYRYYRYPSIQWVICTYIIASPTFQSSFASPATTYKICK